MREMRTISSRMKASLFVGAVGAFILFALLGGVLAFLGSPDDYQIAAPAGTTEKSQ